MKTDGRPDPDLLLSRVVAEEKRARRGKLTVFFGAAPGVGKTYAMLEAARTERDLRRDVVVGVVETHGRYETAALTLGLELVSLRKVLYRGVTLQELDLDAVLLRRPGLVLVDELAHTNAEGSRHGKRWQDVVEILDAGIDVYTTLNVQHLESLNDVVAQITGVIQQETVPDVVLENAHEVKLVDLPPDELLERLGEGKVYVKEQAARATDNFFRKGNLIALRELALRQTAMRVDAQMQRYREEKGIEATWATGERILVCVSSSPASARLVRATRRLASTARAEWLAAYVETPGALRLSSRDRERVAQHLRLAEHLGGQAVTLSGENAADETLRFARSKNVTIILVGKPTHARWRDMIRPSFLDEVVRKSGDINVHVIAGDPLERDPRPAMRARATTPQARGALLASVAVVGVSAAMAWTLFGRDQLADVVMTYLLGIVIVAMRWGYTASLLSAVLSVVTFDFLFVPPYGSFAVRDLRHVVTFGVMFFVAFVISNLTRRLRDQVRGARERELRTSSLYALTRDLASAATREELLRTAARHLHENFDCTLAVFLPGPGGALAPAYAEEWSFVPLEKDQAVATWTWKNLKPAGLSTETLPSASAIYLPMVTQRPVGVLGVAPAMPERFLDAEQRQFLQTCATQVGTALDRARLADESQSAELQVEREQLRNALLSSVSHDLRTPLGIITGSVSVLLDGTELTEESRHELISNTYREAQRLSNLVKNLLDMTRLEAGALTVQRNLQPIDDVIDAAIRRFEDELKTRPLEVDVPADLPVLPLDEALVEQVLINLLENAFKYTPPGSPIRLEARARGGFVEVLVSDRGPGVPRGHEGQVFEKFYRASSEGQRGSGLGLTIARGIVVAHGGTIAAESREGGGATFRFTLPVDEGAPHEGGAARSGESAGS
jgi:two-component system sensor histidine kinase KdpD